MVEIAAVLRGRFGQCARCIVVRMGLGTPKKVKLSFI